MTVDWDKQIRNEITWRFLKNPKESARNFVKMTNLWNIEVAKVLPKTEKVVIIF